MGLNMPFEYTRLNPKPMDDSILFADITDLDTYLSSGGTAYAGQVVSVRNGTNKPDVYVINEDLTSYTAVGSGGSQGFIVIPDNYWFDDETARNLHFTNNPGELKDELAVAVKFTPATTPSTYFISIYSEENTSWSNQYALARGPRGDTPSIGLNGNWFIAGEDTGIKAEGVDGLTPTIDPTSGHWFIGTVDTGVVAEAKDGLTPYIDDTTKTWWIGDVDTEVVAEAKDGLTPYIDPTTKHWFIGTQDTGVKAEGLDGSGIVTVATYADLNPVGVVGTLYIVEEEDATYRWDAATQEYIQVGGGGWDIIPVDNP